MAYISGAVEGMPDEAVLRRIVIARRAEVHRVQVQRGKANLRRALPGYNAAAQGNPWLVLVDLDRDFDCAAALVADWLPAPSAYMRLRVVVREIEAWLLADRENSRASSLCQSRPSRTGRTSSRTRKPRCCPPSGDLGDGRFRWTCCPDRIRADRWVRPTHPVQIEFASDNDRGWRPQVAARRSPSLSSCLTRLDSLIAAAP